MLVYTNLNKILVKMYSVEIEEVDDNEKSSKILSESEIEPIVEKAEDTKSEHLQ